LGQARFLRRNPTNLNIKSGFEIWVVGLRDKATNSIYTRCRILHTCHAKTKAARFGVSAALFFITL
jgi:hypothetical protein